MERSIIGKKFGRLTVKCISHKDKFYKRYFICKCDCGNETIVLEKNLISGNTRSCGCLWKDISSKIRKKHGLRKTRLYSIWAGMRQRTLNKHCSSYKDYGARGIKICNEWQNDFKSFYDWSISHGYKESLTIDRIDFNGDYCPANCRWITKEEQTRNTRKTNNILYNGETHCASEWERLLGYKTGLIYAREHLGWSLQKIMTTPTRKTTIHK